MAERIPEIVVTGKRGRSSSGGGSPFGFRVNQFGGGFISDEEQDRREAREGEDQNEEEEDETEETEIPAVVLTKTKPAKKAIPEIKVTAKRITERGGPKKVYGLEYWERNPVRAKARSDLDRKLREAQMRELAKKLGKPIPEIKVVAKRLPKPVSMLPFGGPLIFGADILAQIADRFSRMRLDEAGRVATRTVRPGPDTKVKTIQPEKIPEIIVKGKRPPVKSPRFTRRDLKRFKDFRAPRVDFPDQRPTAVPTSIVKPKTPSKKKPKLFDLVSSNQQPRSVQLGIPRRRPGQPTTTTPTTTGFPGPGGLTGVNPQVLPLPGVGSSVRTRTCPPCRPKKEKPRTKCYKKLVKERTNPKNDKFYKLVEINCKSGKEVYKPKRKT